MYQWEGKKIGWQPVNPLTIINLIYTIQTLQAIYT